MGRPSADVNGGKPDGPHVVIDDATGLAERLRAAGVDATLDVWANMIHHVWHRFLPMLDEAAVAIERINAFVEMRIA